MATHKLGKHPGANTHGAEPAEDEHTQARDAHGLETEIKQTKIARCYLH
jgi:hypothetical protein